MRDFGERAGDRGGRRARGRVGAALCGALLVGCAGAPDSETTVLAGGSADTVVILPLNVIAPMPAEFTPHGPAVWHALEVYLEAHGARLKTVPFEAARALWIESIRDARARQQLKQPGYDDAARLLVEKLAQYAEFDAVIIPSLAVQRAMVSGTKATWDGAERTIEIEAGHWDAQPPDDAPIQGAAPAASLHAVVLNAQGTKLQESKAGLVLLVAVRLSRSDSLSSAQRLAFVPRRDAFDNPAELWEGVARALAPFLPPLPFAGTAEAHRAR